jgi:hypothetical protein
MTGRIIAATLALALAALGVHLVLAVAAVVIAVTLAVLAAGIFILVAECGWRIQPCRRRFAW